MPDIRYADLAQCRAERVTTIGSIVGPPGGDGWTQVCRLPQGTMPAGAGEWAVMVSGRIGIVEIAGAAPAAGAVQVCVGTTFGTRLPHMCVTIPLTHQMPAAHGMPFQMLVFIAAADPDPVLGSSFDFSGGSELCLWARTLRNGDSANYYVEFDVADVSWLWFHLSSMPAGDVVLHTDDSQASFTSVRGNLQRSRTPAIGEEGQTWLHASTFHYEPRSPGAWATRFRAVAAPEGSREHVVANVTMQSPGILAGAPGTFEDDAFEVGRSLQIAGSSASMGAGGNNTPPWFAFPIQARAADRSWVRLFITPGSSVAQEGPTTFTLTSWLLETKIGSAGWWGMNAAATVPLAPAQRTPMLCQGGFWGAYHSGADYAVGYEAHEMPATPAGAILHRFRHLAVRLDRLPDARVLSLPEPALVGTPITGPWRDRYQIVERPALQMLVEPIVMVHQSALLGGVVAGTQTRVLESDGRRHPPPAMFDFVDSLHGGLTSSTWLGRRQFQVASPAMRWHVHCVGSAGATAVFAVHDMHLVSFHPVRDPSNVTNTPGNQLPPVVLVPGRQSADPNSLQAPPFLPNGDPGERYPNWPRGAIVGVQGYRRTWPVGAKPKLAIALQWGPLPLADAHTVYDFLVANPIWRHAMQTGELVAVMNHGQVELQPGDGDVAVVDVEVVVLVWTGDA